MFVADFFSKSDEKNKKKKQLAWKKQLLYSNVLNRVSKLPVSHITLEKAANPNIFFRDVLKSSSMIESLLS